MTAIYGKEKEKEQEQKENAGTNAPVKPLFYTVAIDTITGSYDARSNAGNVQQVQTIANALLQEYQRLNSQIIAAVSQNGAAKQEA